MFDNLNHFSLTLLRKIIFREYISITNNRGLTVMLIKKRVHSITMVTNLKTHLTPKIIHTIHISGHSIKIEWFLPFDFNLGVTNVSNTRGCVIQMTAGNPMTCISLNYSWQCFTNILTTHEWVFGKQSEKKSTQ
jgi:hypothetical protein